MDELITVNFDGGSRGNPGIAGTGVVLRAADGTPVITIGRYIGHATNNVAEYTALIEGLRQAKNLGAKKILVRGDSELVIKQMRGEYRVKNPALKQLYAQAARLADEFDSVRYEHNFREDNSLADRLANLAMDKKTMISDADDLPFKAPAAKLPSKPSAATSNHITCPKCGHEIPLKSKS
jgi:ribonuclease HI